MNIDDVIKFLNDHNIKSINVDRDEDEIIITEHCGEISVLSGWIDVNENNCPECKHEVDLCECDVCQDCCEAPCSCAECTYCGSKPCVC